MDRIYLPFVSIYSSAGCKRVILIELLKVMVFCLVHTHGTYKLLITLVEALLQYLVKITWSFLGVQVMEL